MKIGNRAYSLDIINVSVEIYMYIAGNCKRYNFEFKFFYSSPE